jgi:8-amino-7-oxononanoate synthase
MERIADFLKERKNNNLLRTLHAADFRKAGRISFKGKAYIDLSSNDYLGLSSHPRLLEAAKRAIERWGMSSSASRLLSGDLELHHQLEEQVAIFKDQKKALVYNSGYQANIGIISSLCQKGDVIFSDRLNHASIADGILLSGARFFRFGHNDMDHLELLLKKERNKFKEALIITETIFSMDGDRCPLKEIVRLKEKYNCRLLLDEAHATGIFGKQGGGLAEEEGLGAKVDLIMGTFSKALGSFGAYIAGPKKIIDYLINSSRSFIYSTALPPPVIAANLVSLDLIKKEAFRRRRLLENADYFRKQLHKRGLRVLGSSQIIPFVVGENQQAVALSQGLQDRGYWVLPVRPPTVPAGQARLRFSLTYYHDREILDRLVDDICAI